MPLKRLNAKAAKDVEKANHAGIIEVIIKGTCALCGKKKAAIE